jgi:hypothetical protein
MFEDLNILIMINNNKGTSKYYLIFERRQIYILDVFIP